MKHPARQRKSDRLMGMANRKGEIACDEAIAPFDRAMRAAEQRWGIDRLTSLVSPETAAKWGATIESLNAAIAANDPQLVAQWVGVCLRGLPHLEAEAVASGAEQMPPVILEHRDERSHFVVIQNTGDWPIVERLRPGVQIVTLQEVAVAMDASRLHVLNETKKHFPNAQMTAIRERTLLEKELNDEIVF